jgi:membrane protease YdiL (CAAX protease family)
MTLFDHLFVLVFAIAQPIAGYASFQKLLRRVDAGETIDRTELYDVTTWTQWSLFFLAIIIWVLSDRSFPSLGFTLPLDTNFLVAAVLTGVGIALLLVQFRQVSSASTDEMRKFRGQFGNVDFIIPRNGNELGRFYKLSITAGIVEEALWRGYLFWYLGHFMPIWGAAVVSTVGFGVAHAYQGVGNLPRITLVGAVFAVLFLLTGSLWLPIILHAAIDIVQGRLGYEVMHRTELETVAEPEDDASVIGSS